MAKDQTTNPVPQCPRCGYDQSGLIATWESSCPLEGVCSECGYAFRWREVFDPDAHSLARYVEHCPRWLVPIVTLRTLAWTLIPHLFWSRIKLHHEVRPGRLFLWLACVLIGLHVLGSVIAGSALWYAHDRVGGGWSPYRNLGSNAQYSMAVVGRVEPPFSFIEHIGVAASFPLYRVGIEENNPWQKENGWLIELWPVTVWGLLALSLAFPLVMLLLSDTRKLTKVRPAHLLRATVLGYAWLAIPLLQRLISSSDALVLLVLDGWDRSPLLDGTIARWWPIGSLVVAGWIGWWWYAALARGFQIKHTMGHWIVLMIASVLAAGVFMVVVQPHQTGFLLDSLTDLDHYGRDGDVWSWAI